MGNSKIISCLVSRSKIFSRFPHGNLNWQPYNTNLPCTTSYSLSCPGSSFSLMKKLFFHPPSRFLPLRFASSFSDLNHYSEEDYSEWSSLYRNIDYDYERTTEEALKNLKDDMIPYEIIEIPGKVAINLKREFAGERIECVLDWDFKDDTRYQKKAFSLDVTIDKGYPPRYHFSCTLDYKEREMAIDRLLIKGPEESSDAYEVDLDEALHDGFLGYLRLRGIERGWETDFRMYMWYKVESYLKNMVDKLDSNSDNPEEVKKELCMYYYSLD